MWKEGGRKENNPDYITFYLQSTFHQFEYGNREIIQLCVNSVLFWLFLPKLGLEFAPPASIVLLSVQWPCRVLKREC